MSTKFKKSIIVFFSVLICITFFPFTTQDSFGETRQECRSSKGADQSLTPVERILVLQTCDSSENTMSFQEIYTEELHNECQRRTAQDVWNNHVLRLEDLEKCDVLQENDLSLTKQKITKFSKEMIQFCDEKYGVYQLVGAKKMTNHAGKYTFVCLNLYSTPIWNSTENDRAVQLHNFLMNKIQQHLEETKDIRQKNVEESRLSRPIITNFKDLFNIQKEKIEFLENQLQEKNLKSNYLQQDFFSEKLEECSRIYYDNTILLEEKITALNECSGIETIEPITINRTKILEYSKYVVQFCEESYAHFSKLSKQDYYNNSTNDPLTSSCVMLYSDPIWDYNHYDRTQVLETFLHYKTVKNIYEISQVRENSSDRAILDSGWDPILIDIYKYQKQKIEMLEDLLNVNQN
jgi:hypothetical protein